MAGYILPEKEYIPSFVDGCYDSEADARFCRNRVETGFVCEIS